jgi:8-oxo-dGTP diphosphatase
VFPAGDWGVGGRDPSTVVPPRPARPTSPRSVDTVPPMEAEEVRAAGGLVVRDGEVAVVHRPKYDDWSLPKGKLDPGETWEQAAVREVEEETGIRARIVAELAPSHYRDRKGRPKTVRWYRMEVEDVGTFDPGAEVDELRWLAPAEASALVDYDHDRVLLGTLV